jgi:hypothetical protein
MENTAKTASVENSNAVCGNRQAIFEKSDTPTYWDDPSMRRGRVSAKSCGVDSDYILPPRQAEEDFVR